MYFGKKGEAVVALVLIVAVAVLGLFGFKELSDTTSSNSITGGVIGLENVSVKANCGGVAPCTCGDTVTSSYEFTSDLGPCDEFTDALIIGAESITLDCHGFQLL